jgi:hypothetical protein
VTVGAHSTFIVTFSSRSSSSSRRLSARSADPDGELVGHRSGPVEGLFTEAPGVTDALCSGLAHLVSHLCGRVRPSSRLQGLSTALDPEPPVEVNDADRDMVLESTTTRDVVGCSSTFVLAVPAAASMRAMRRPVLRCSAGWTAGGLSSITVLRLCPALAAWTRATRALPLTTPSSS